MAREDFKEDLTQARAEYFRAADKVLEKIEKKFGTGREGFLNFINNNDVESVKPQDKNAD